MWAKKSCFVLDFFCLNRGSTQCLVEETCVPKKSVAVENLVLVYNFFCAATLFLKLENNMGG